MGTCRELTISEYRAITRALNVLESVLREPGVALSSPRRVAEYLQLRIGALEHEVFAVLLLDAQHRVLEYVELFRGTLTQTAVYPREVAKIALAANAAAVILAHNHPSGLAEPSAADRALTSALKTALATLDIAVLDHVIVAGRTSCSLAERGWL